MTPLVLVSGRCSIEGAAEQAEVAIGVAYVEPEQPLDDVVVHAADHLPVPRSRPG